MSNSKGFWNLMFITLCWFSAVFAVSSVNTTIGIWFFCITFPLIVIIAVLFARDDAKDILGKDFKWKEHQA